ncbi:MAG: hypothetical protein KDC10_13880 [Calditrichaeota bacterium]|nr:hypothetical protein [Calditrichota bacterium]
MQSDTRPTAVAGSLSGLIVSMLPLLLLLGLAAGARAQYGISWPQGHLEIDGRIRVGFHHRWLFPEDPDQDRNKDRIYVQQARLRLSGWQYSSHLRWEMQFELRGYNGLEREPGHELDHQGVEAKDLHLSWVPNDLWTLRAGQFKVPYGRKQLVGLHEQSLVRRADLVDGFLPGRDRGLMLRGRTGDRVLTGWAGVFSGNGENLQYNDSRGGWLWVGRLQWQPFGDIGDGEGDHLGLARPLLLLGVNATSSVDRPPLDPEALEYKRTVDGRKRLLGADASLKWLGWQLMAEVDHARFQPAVGGRYRAGGWLGQVSHCARLDALGLKGWLLEPVLSYDEYNPSDRTADDTQRTLTTWLNLMPDGHDLKLMLDWFHRLKYRDTDRNPWKEDEIRAIVQLAIH